MQKKTDAHVSLSEYLSLVRTSRKLADNVAAAWDAMSEGWRERGVAEHAGQSYRGALVINYRHPAHCIAREDVARFARAMGHAIGGYPPKGDWLIRAEAAASLNVQPDKHGIPALWERMEAAIAGGAETFQVGGETLRVKRVSSGTRSAAAIHPDDVEALARGMGLTLHSHPAWEAGWLNMREVAEGCGTHSTNRMFRKAWDGLGLHVTQGTPPFGDAAIRAAWMRRVGVVTLFLHRDSLDAFVRRTGLDEALAKPPEKTPEWRGTVEFAKELRTAPQGLAYQAMLARLIAQVEAGEEPTLDGEPLPFERRIAGVQTPYCFHVSASERVASHLGLVDAPERSVHELPRQRVFMACGASSAGNLVSWRVWDECVAQWGTSDVAVVDGRRLRGGLRTAGFGNQHWCIDEASLPDLVAIVEARTEARERQEGELGRSEAIVELRAYPRRRAEFVELWKEIEAAALASNGGIVEVRGKEIATRVTVRTAGTREAVCVAAASVPVMAELIGLTTKRLVDEADGYVSIAAVSREAGIARFDERMEVVVEEIQAVLDEGGEPIFDGKVIDCGYLRNPKTPFAVARDSIPDLLAWREALRSNAPLATSSAVEGPDDTFLEDGDLESMFDM